MIKFNDLLVKIEAALDRFVAGGQRLANEVKIIASKIHIMFWVKVGIKYVIVVVTLAIIVFGIPYLAFEVIATFKYIIAAILLFLIAFLLVKKIGIKRTIGIVVAIPVLAMIYDGLFNSSQDTFGAIKKIASALSNKQQHESIQQRDTINLLCKQRQIGQETRFVTIDINKKYAKISGYNDGGSKQYGDGAPCEPIDLWPMIPSCNTDVHISSNNIQMTRYSDWRIDYKIEEFPPAVYGATKVLTELGIGLPKSSEKQEIDRIKLEFRDLGVQDMSNSIDYTLDRNTGSLFEYSNNYYGLYMNKYGKQTTINGSTKPTVTIYSCEVFDQIRKF